MRKIRQVIKNSSRSVIFSRISNDSGVSLPELVASIPLAALVFLIMGLAIVNFATTYQETRLYTQLQDELFQAIESIRHGVTMNNVTEGEGIIGVMTAGKVSINSGRNRIRIIPVILSQGLGEESYSANFWINNGQLMANGFYGVKNFSNHVVFPSGNRKIDNFNMFRITDITFRNEAGTMSDVSLLGIVVEAQVRFREKLEDQSVEEDIEQNTKSIKYQTSIMVGNSSKI
jgi:hypothetical protein